MAKRKNRDFTVDLQAEILDLQADLPNVKKEIIYLYLIRCLQADLQADLPDVKKEIIDLHFIRCLQADLLDVMREILDFQADRQADLQADLLDVKKEIINLHLVKDPQADHQKDHQKDLLDIVKEMINLHLVKDPQVDLQADLQVDLLNPLLVKEIFDLVGKMGEDLNLPQKEIQVFHPFNDRCVGTVA